MNFSFINLSLVSYLFSCIFYFAHLVFKRKTTEFIAKLMLSLGFLFLTFSIINRWHKAGRPPLADLYESLIFFSWSVAIFFIIFDFIYKLRFMGMFVALLILFALGFASLLDDTVQPLIPALQSNWLTIHVVSYFLGYGLVTLSFILSMIYLFRLRRLNLEEPSSLRNLDILSYRLIALGFPFLTIGLTTGAVWANVAWGSYWSWDPKETWSLITWLIYAIYLHLRIIKGWQGKKSAYLNIIGFLAVLFTFFGVNFLLSGLHSYL